MKTVLLFACALMLVAGMIFASSAFESEEIEEPGVSPACGEGNCGGGCDGSCGGQCNVPTCGCQ